MLKNVETNVQARQLHNVKVAQSKAGWTKADVMKAIADAQQGIIYNRS